MAKNLSIIGDSEDPKEAPAKAKEKLSIPHTDPLMAAKAHIAAKKVIDPSKIDPETAKHGSYLRKTISDYRVPLDSMLNAKYAKTPNIPDKSLTPEEGEAAIAKHTGQSGGYKRFIDHVNTFSDMQSKTKGFEARKPNMANVMTTKYDPVSGGGYRVDYTAPYDKSIQDIFAPEPQNEVTIKLPTKKK